MFIFLFNNKCITIFRKIKIEKINKDSIKKNTNFKLIFLLFFIFLEIVFPSSYFIKLDFYNLNTKNIKEFFYLQKKKL